MAKVSLEKDKIKFLLVEGVHQKAVENLRAAGYTNIEFHKGALDSEELKASIRDAHFIGLRSRTHLTEEIFAAAEKLVAVGCFCIGTNQVDLAAAEARGIPVQVSRESLRWTGLSAPGLEAVEDGPWQAELAGGRLLLL